jgi:electron transport complex protein RnfG
MSQRTALLRPAFLLGALGLAAALLLGGLNRLTEDRIAQEQRERALGAVAAMLEPGSYDNALLDDRIEIDVAGLDPYARVYRARLGGEPQAAVFDVSTRQGYSGPIRLLVAVSREGRVLGVRVLEHRETPGLGDRIEREKSDWVEQFDGRSLGQPPVDEWAADRRGGEFDTLTSATITSTAVIETVRAVLQTHQTRTETVYARPTEQEETP